ncbi:hypothetical protein MKJ01_17855 [Chryseobacterium sp. SSA4.19]|uniref:hypothetical protein n=1 Tax=Chryseobacterium sp. SSA4.19 TaxID=2919915 RepID=UPI001F4DBB97|nr:hypothetical protein [Chryseobacterium sp. SSA4.19]MCJ8155626.1 hypothetical protein [Chryseobacterium sp. SSA4.19]
MNTPITADHVLFDDCIYTFRNSGYNSIDDNAMNKLYCVILSPFEITSSWDLGHCIIHPSQEVRIDGPYLSFVNIVEISDKIHFSNCHLYSHALCAILSSITLTPFKSPRNRHYYRTLPSLSQEALKVIANSHPILFAGPVGNVITLSHEEQFKIRDESIEIINKLHSLNYDSYVIFMQNFRMLHLSLINKREDFGLAYSLIVASIESAAQKAIKREKVKDVNPKDAIWSKLSENDPEFAQVFKAYKISRGLNTYLKERYVKFILEYAPISEWELNVPDRNKKYIESSQGSDLDLKEIERHYNGNHPIDLSIDEINEILAQSYKHRSNFIHQGKQPPHREPNTTTRFFQTFSIYNNEGSLQNVILPNYELMLSIAKQSLTNWLFKKFE